MDISIDLETFSDADIKKVGAHRYVESPVFDILLCAMAIDDQAPIVYDCTLDAERSSCRAELTRLLFDTPDATIHAYNAAFEITCIAEWLRRALPLDRWRCTQAHALYCGYPRGLAATGAAMGLPQDKRKLSIGSALIRTFCVPQKPTKARPDRTRILPQDEPEKWELFKAYNAQDVETEREIEKRLSKWPVPGYEQQLWRQTLEMNARGTGVDLDLIDGALDLETQLRTALIAEAKALSGLGNPNSAQQLAQWLNDEEGVDLENLRAATILDALTQGLTSAKATRMLQIRQQLSKTSTKKYAAMRATVCDDGRVHGLLMHYGTRTGRWAGRLVQVQNLPRNYLEPLDLARERVKMRDADTLQACWGDLPSTLSQLIRTAFVPRDGYEFAVADYSAIEARVIAWLAGEEWALEVFRTTGKIYEATAAQMFGVSIDAIKKGRPEYALRQKGKIATLALGYGGGEGALTAMGALKMGLKENELTEIKTRWRAANPHVVALWRELDDAAFTAMKRGIAICAHSKIAMRYETDTATSQDFLTIELPNGRKLYYVHPHIAPARNHPDRESIHYYSTDVQSKFSVSDTWGGKLAENIVQAIARDCLAEALLAMEDAGLDIVFHVHDEAIVEAPTGSGALETMLAIMGRSPMWAPGLPLKGAGFVAPFYQKD